MALQQHLLSHSTREANAQGCFNCYNGHERPLGELLQLQSIREIYRHVVTTPRSGRVLEESRGRSKVERVFLAQ